MIKKQKGFTLVEVIVVLIVLAILAAILVPQLTGYIDKANERALIAECRAAVQAAKVLGNEAYVAHRTYTAAMVEELAEVSGQVSAIELSGDGRQILLHLTYSHNGRGVTYRSSPSTCAAHDETYNLDDEAQGSLSQRISAMGDNIKDAYDALPANLRYPRIDSVALSDPSSVANMLYAQLTPAQQRLLNGYEWCTYIQPEGFRFFMVDKNDIAAGDPPYPAYKYNPETGKFQKGTGARMRSDGRIDLNIRWDTTWYDSLE